MSAELRLCGPPSLTLGGRSCPWTASAPRALLVLLACRGAWWTREALAAVLRPDAPDVEALRYLRQLVHRARKAPEAAGLEVDGDRLRWRVPSDVARFRSACAERDPDALGVAVEAFLAGWRFPGEGFAAWAEAERQELMRLRRRLARDVALERAASGDPAAAADAAEVLLADDPLDEATVAEVMGWRLAAGDGPGALATYMSFEWRLAEEVGAVPSAATRALAQRARATGSRRSPPSVSGPPTVATPFLGRERELGRLAATLAGEGPRVVALVGLGGAGKTRLVTEAAGHARRSGRRVVFVSLAEASPDDDVTRRISAALPVGWDIVDPLARWDAWVARGPALLVLDEAEDAYGLDDWWAHVARHLGEVRVWLTSRRAPRWSAATVWPLDGLPVPQPDAGRAAARASNAVRLLLERAGFDPDAVDDADVAAAAGVARALGGHPLALELAAASSRGVPPSVAFGDLEIDLGAIRSDAADVPVRHRDLDALLEESWRVLPAPARRAARRLTLIRGHFDLAAARAVACLDAGGLSRLLDRALVQRVGLDRYDVHALVRRSAPAPEPADLDAHAVWALGRVAALGASLKGEGHAAAIAELVALSEDARAGWAHAVGELEAGRRHLLTVLDAALGPLDHAWYTAGRLGLAAVVYGDAVRRARPPAEADDATGAWRRWWARVAVRWSVVERTLGRPDAARKLLEEVARTAEGDTRLEARLELAKIAYYAGRTRAAETAYRAFLADPGHRRRPDLASAAHADLAAILWTTAQDVAEALAHDDAALLEARRDGDPDALIVALINGGAGSFELGLNEDAERRWREAAALAGAIGHGAREAAVQNNLGMLAVRCGRPAEARAAYERALALRRSAGDVTGQAAVLLHLGQLEAAEGDLANASTHLETAVAAFDRPGWEESRSMALSAWSELASGQHDARRAEPRAREALQIACRTASVRAILTALLALARAWRAGDRTCDAAALSGRVAAFARGREAAIADGCGRLLAEIEQERGHPALVAPRGGRPQPMRRTEVGHLGAGGGAAADVDLPTFARTVLREGVRASAGWNAVGTPHR